MDNDPFGPDSKRFADELQSTGNKDNQDHDKPPEDQDVECVDTRIWLWDGEQYEEFESDYLNQIFPYKLSKKTVSPGSQFIFHFLASSLHYWVQLNHNSTPEPDKLSSKDSKVIRQILRNEECDNWIAFRRWGEQFDQEQQFLKHADKDADFRVPSGGRLIHQYNRGDSQFRILEYQGNNKEFHAFKQRMEVLLLFYIDGVSFVFEEVDTWLYYIVFRFSPGSERPLFAGMLSKYVFRLSALRQRHRISQVFVLPPYQRAGHGKELIDAVYAISLKDSKCFEITTQIPSFEYQCLRDFKQLEMVIGSSIFELESLGPLKSRQQMEEARIGLLSKERVRRIKQELKIPGHQIQRLVNILLYHQVLKKEDEFARATFEEELKNKIVFNRSPFKTRRRLPHLTLFGKVPNMKDFMIEKAKQEVLRNQEEVLEIQLETVNGFNRVIAKCQKAHLLS